MPLWLTHPIIPRLNNLPASTNSSGQDSVRNVFQDSPHGAPNHVLVNEYQPGQGIMPHEDGAAYWPVVGTVSLGAPIVLDIYGKNKNGRRQETPQWRILQEARSLLITADEMYNEYLHGIADTFEDYDLRPSTIANWEWLGEKEQFEGGSYKRSTRTSLTYRDVLKVSDLGKKLKLFRQ
ncbi:MAG: hypothetical protein M1837_004073 [Sclerophora amabilis]|nr:MAG: hypothetical protein M1837_004073 [Sclerophora amabilis]